MNKNFTIKIDEAVLMLMHKKKKGVDTIGQHHWRQLLSNL